MCSLFLYLTRHQVILQVITAACTSWRLIDIMLALRGKHLFLNTPPFLSVSYSFHQFCNVPRNVDWVTYVFYSFLMDVSKCMWMCMWVAEEAEEIIRSPETRSRDGCDLPDKGNENQTLVLCNNNNYSLTTEPFRLPIFYSFAIVMSPSHSLSHPRFAV